MEVMDVWGKEVVVLDNKHKDGLKNVNEREC